MRDKDKVFRQISKFRRKVVAYGNTNKQRLYRKHFWYMTDRIRFYRKFIACLILSLWPLAHVLQLGTPPRPAWIPQAFVFSCALLSLVIPLIGLPVWESRERRRPTDPPSIYSGIQTRIAYLTGFNISLFGWKKLFHLQFRMPLSIADLPMSQLDGETLTWYYFGHSYVFACIIGVIQIAGSFLLFFRRTRFAWALLLFPVMLNILLINIFYQMNAGALLQSILLTLGLLYIILQEYPALLSLLFPARLSPVNHKRQLQWIASGVVSLLAFLFILNSSHRLPMRSNLYGRYEVREMSVNGRPLSAVGDGNKDSVLTRVYFDLDNVCVLEYNSQNRRLLARYTLDKSHETSDSWRIESRFLNKGKEVLLAANISLESEQEFLLRGRFSGDWIEMTLRKTK